LVNEPSAPDGLCPQTASAAKHSAPRAYVILAILGWLAAGFSYWHQSIDKEPPPTPPVASGEDREKVETEVNPTQQKLATTQSALAITTRLRDEAAQALQEVREISAGVSRDLAAAQSELDDIQQKIVAQSSELATITKRLDTKRLRESQGKKKPDGSPRTVAPATPSTAATAASSTAQEPPPPAPVGHGEDREKVEAKVNPTQQKLATTQSALAMTTRLRDEAALALQEDRKKSAGMRKDLATARSELDDIRQKIVTQSSELAAITKRLDTARLLESQGKKGTDANDRTVAPATPSTAVSTPPPASAAIELPSVQPVESPPKSIERRTSPIARTRPSDTTPPIPAAKPSLEASPEPTPRSDRKSRKVSDSKGSNAVIGPGASSSPSDFELHSGRISRTP
jgi:predicted  nucleic acid-binding Zn-ribbon protein